MSKKFRVLSLDVSGSSTGWSFIATNSRKHHYGTIKTSSKDCLAKRLTVFRKALIKLFDKYKPNIILLEDTFVGKNPKVNKLLSKFGGVAEQLVYEFLKVPPIIISNKTVKAFFCVKTKEALFEVISDLCVWGELNTFKKYNDIADSLAQLLYYLQTENFKIIKREVPYGYIYE
jgi:Holliday junction resolvasome RuvABC endonuclease subunit